MSCCGMFCFHYPRKKKNYRRSERKATIKQVNDCETKNEIVEKEKKLITQVDLKCFSSDGMVLETVITSDEV